MKKASFLFCTITLLLGVISFRSMAQNDHTIAANTAKIEVYTIDLTGATLYIDSIKVGTTPYNNTIIAGKHILQITKEGFKPFQFEFTIEAGSSISLPFVLEKQKTDPIPAKLSNTTPTPNIKKTTTKKSTAPKGINSKTTPKKRATSSSKKKNTLIAPIIFETEMINLKSGLKIGKYEVTQKEWKIVMKNNPSRFKGDNLPVECVSWNDVSNFIKRLNAGTGKKYRLPTKTEWQYAAKGGEKNQNQRYSGSNEIDSCGWCKSNSLQMTHIVGTKKPNEIGIYDMSGNVREWCGDFYDPSTADKLDNHRILTKGLSRNCCGGSWDSFAQYCEIINLDFALQESRSATLGFRLVLEEDPSTEKIIPNEQNRQ